MYVTYNPHPIPLTPITLSNLMTLPLIPTWCETPSRPQRSGRVSGETRSRSKVSGWVRFGVLQHGRLSVSATSETSEPHRDVLLAHRQLAHSFTSAHFIAISFLIPIQFNSTPSSPPRVSLSRASLGRTRAPSTQAPKGTQGATPSVPQAGQPQATHHTLCQRILHRSICH